MLKLSTYKFYKRFSREDIYMEEIRAKILGYEEETLKVKVVLYTFVRRGVPVREDTYAEPSACEVGWPVPFLAAFISPSVSTGYPVATG